MTIDLEEEKKYHHDSERLKKEHERLNIDCVDLHFEGIQINEIILQRGFNSLLDGLDKIYTNTPTIDKYSYKQSELKDWVSDSNALGKRFLPTLYAKDTDWSNADLPLGIRSIKIDLQKYSGDFISLNICFFINDKESEDFKNILTKIDKPDIVTKQELGEDMISIYPVRRTKERNIEGFISSIKERAIIYLSGYLSFGEFYKEDTQCYFKNFPSMNIFSFAGEEEIFIGNSDLLWIIGLYPIDSMRYTIEGKTFFSLKENTDNESTLVIKRGDDWERGFGRGILHESFFSYLGILSYLKLLDKSIEITIQSIISSNLSKKLKDKKQTKLIQLIHIFNRMKWLVERMYFEKIGLLRERGCDCCDNDFSGEYKKRIKDFTKQQSKIYNQSISSIEGLVNLENTSENKKLSRAMLILTGAMAIMMIEYNEKSLVEFLLNIIGF